jgi:hypothetical protein
LLTNLKATSCAWGCEWVGVLVRIAASPPNTKLQASVGRMTDPPIWLDCHSPGLQDRATVAMLLNASPVQS